MLSKSFQLFIFSWNTLWNIQVQGDIILTVVSGTPTNITPGKLIPLYFAALALTTLLLKTVTR